MREDITVRVPGVELRSHEVDTEVDDDGMTAHIPVAFTGKDGEEDWGTIVVRVDEDRESLIVEKPGPELCYRDH